MRKRKILCLIDCLSSGGAQRQLVGLAKLLAERGYEVEVLTYHDLPFYKSILEQYGIRNHNIYSSNNLYKIWEIRKFIKCFSPHILIAYQEMPSLIACILKLTIPQIRLIVSERNTSQKMGLFEYIRFFFYRLSDYVVPNSQTQANYINTKCPYLKSKIEVITNFVDTINFAPKKQSRRNKIPIIIVVASEKKEKNFYRFACAIALLKKKRISFKVNWYGINKNFIKEFQNYLRCLDINDIMTVQLPQVNIQQIYQESDFFCLPSLYEGFPNALCEAMSCGLPIVASNICDNPDIVEDGVDGFLFDPLSIVDIADKIELLFKLDNESIIQMRKLNRLKSEDLFSEKKFIEKYINLIESL